MSIGPVRPLPPGAASQSLREREAIQARQEYSNVAVIAIRSGSRGLVCTLYIHLLSPQEMVITVDERQVQAIRGANLYIHFDGDLRQSGQMGSNTVQFGIADLTCHPSQDAQGLVLFKIPRRGIRLEVGTCGLIGRRASLVRRDGALVGDGIVGWRSGA